MEIIETYQDRLDQIESALMHSSNVDIFEKEDPAVKFLVDTVEYLKNNYDGQTSSYVRSHLRKKFSALGWDADDYFEKMTDDPEAQDFSVPATFIGNEIAAVCEGKSNTDDSIAEAQNIIIASSLVALHCAVYDLPEPGSSIQ